MNDDLFDLRHQYSDTGLTVEEMMDHPVDQFQEWFADAYKHSQRDLSNAMTLATADGSGAPSARVVLLKHVDRDGFVFYTNYESRKGRELSENPAAALVFWWPALERQVRVEGRVRRLSADASDRYFASRPRGSQLSAWVSRQSRVVEGREVLEKRLQGFAEKFRNDDVPRPEYWGGYCLEPAAVEFWQGQSNRLHDRVLYERGDEGWERRRLAP